MTSSSTPRVSIIIITYNNEAFIEKSVQSTIDQAYISKEIIVIDDGSTDNTRQILEPYMDKIRYHYQENAGISNARNKGLELAQGEFINQMDGNDYFLDPDKITDQVALLEQHPNWGMVQGGLQLIDDNNHPFHYLHPWEQLPIEPTIHDVISRLWFNLQPSLLRREWFDQVGWFDLTYPRREDIRLIMKMVAQGMIIGLQQKEVVAYRISFHKRDSYANDVRDADIHLRVWIDLFDSGIFPPDIMQARRTLMLFKIMWSAYLVARISEFAPLSNYLAQVVTHCPPSYNCAMIGYYWLAFAINQNHYLKREFIDRNALIEYLLKSPIFEPVLPTEVNATIYINWWVDVWWVYHQLEIILKDDAIFLKQGLNMPSQLRTMNAQPIKHLIKLAQNAITHTAPLPSRQSVDTVTQFWSDVTLARQTPSEYHQVVTLYLTMMTRSIFAKQFSVAWYAFRKAVSVGVHPRVLPLWFRFFRASAQYVLQKVSR